MAEEVGWLQGTAAWLVATGLLQASIILGIIALIVYPIMKQGGASTRGGAMPFSASLPVLEILSDLLVV